MGTARRRGHRLVSMPFLLVLLAWPGSAVAAAWHVHPSPPAASHATEHDHGTAGHDEAGGHDHGTAEPGGTEPGSELGADHNGEHSTGAGHGTDVDDGHISHGSSAPDPDRPLGLLLGGFGAVNGVALVAAAVLRRRNRAADEQRRARRTAKRAVPPHPTGAR